MPCESSLQVEAIQFSSADAIAVSECQHAVGLDGPDEASQTVSVQEFKVQNMDELKAKAPEMYQALLRWFANNLIRSMQASNNRIKSELRKARHS